MKVDNRFVSFINCILMKIVIEYGYANGVGQVFGYTGIEIEINKFRLCISWMFALIVFWFACYRIRQDYLWILNMLFMMLSYIPTMSMWGIKSEIENSAIFATAFCMVSMVFSCRVFQVITKKTGNDINDNSFQDFLKNKIHILRILVICFFLFAIVFNLIYANGRIFLSFADSVDVRLAMREVNIPTIPRYIYMMLGGAILPISLSCCLYLRKYGLTLICIVTSILLYAVNGMKTWLLIYVVIFALFFLTMHIDNIPAIINIIFLGVSAFWIVGMVLYKHTGVYIILSYLHRTQTLPAELHYYYYDFFQTHSFLYLRDSVMRVFFESPYTNTVSRLIGLYYYFSPTMNCTNGVFSDFYGNFGYLGLCIYPYMIYTCYRVLARSLLGTGRFITLSVFFTLTIVLFDNTFFTWMLTGGYIIVVLMFRFIKKAS